MNKQEILNLLAEKRRLTAPAARALDELTQLRNQYAKASSRFSKTMIACAAIGLLCLVFSAVSTAIWWFLAVAILFAIRFALAQPVKEKRDAAQEKYNSEINQPDYIKGKEGFPEKFYNYRDAYRLYKIIEEGRAYTLPEAYTLLENQQFQETQLSHQEEMVALQADIAASARKTATNTTISAISDILR